MEEPNNIEQKNSKIMKIAVITLAAVSVILVTCFLATFFSELRQKKEQLYSSIPSPTMKRFPATWTPEETQKPPPTLTPRSTHGKNNTSGKYEGTGEDYLLKSSEARGYSIVSDELYTLSDWPEHHYKRMFLNDNWQTELKRTISNVATIYGSNSRARESFLSVCDEIRSDSFFIDDLENSENLKVNESRLFLNLPIVGGNSFIQYVTVIQDNNLVIILSSETEVVNNNPSDYELDSSLREHMMYVESILKPLQ